MREGSRTERRGFLGNDLGLQADAFFRCSGERPCAQAIGEINTR